jgi:DNA-binding MarR family transcriptional regulator
VDIQDLVTGIRWELLQMIVAAPATGAELARALSTTPANVSQHLKLLELGGLVSKERANGKAMHYRLAQRAVLVTLLDAPATRAVVTLDPIAAAEMRLLTEGAENGGERTTTKALRKFLSQYEDLVRTFTACGRIDSPHENPGEVQLLVISEDLRPLRKEYSNVKIGDIKIVIWSHTAAEFAEGLSRKDHYFTEKLHLSTPLIDPDELFAHWNAQHFPEKNVAKKKVGLKQSAGKAHEEGH